MMQDSSPPPISPVIAGCHHGVPSCQLHTPRSCKLQDLVLSRVQGKGMGLKIVALGLNARQNIIAQEPYALILVLQSQSRTLNSKPLSSQNSTMMAGSDLST